jgi:transcriptional regulator with XRE-family HTH domain
MIDESERSRVGLQLRELRQNLGWSLREVERRSRGQVHNAYLSQIETGRVKDPSVELLATLAHLYGADLWQLMHRAGWVPEHYRDDGPDPEPTGWDLLPRALFDDLTPDEVDEVVEYVKLIKRRRRRRAAAAREREEARGR